MLQGYFSKGSCGCLMFVIALVMLCGCGSRDKECVILQKEYCQDGKVYLRENCEDPAKIKQACECGCNPEGTACLSPCDNTTDCDPACHASQDCVAGICQCKSNYPNFCTSRLCCLQSETCRTDTCCAPKNSFQCDGGHVYWFDSCSVKEDQKEACGCGCTDNACDNCSSTDNLAFVSDVTIPDNTNMQPGQTFTKTWRVKNTGTATWTDGAGYKLKFVSGVNMSASEEKSFSGSDVAPNATYDWSLSMTAPQTDGTHRGDWKMYRNAIPFGETIWVQIVVGTVVDPDCNPPCEEPQKCVKGKCCTKDYFTCNTAGQGDECCSGECCVCPEFQLCSEGTKMCRFYDDSCDTTCFTMCIP